MCGIVAFSGKKSSAVKTVFEGLKKLEYRGYDSWGIFAVSKPPYLVKKVGKISLHKESSWPKAYLALGHTRWATHGGINEKNAHPHLSFHSRLVLVHNGVFENYLEVKSNLCKRGYIFKSDTDSEVLCTMIEDELRNNKSLPEIFQKLLPQIEGRNAFVVYDKESETLAGVRQGSPLAVGFSREGIFIASDTQAFIPQATKMSFLDDGEAVFVQNTGCEFWNIGKMCKIVKERKSLSPRIKGNSKGKHSSYLIKEIREQKAVLFQTVEQDDKKIMEIVKEIRNAQRIYAVGAGTAGKVSLWGSHVLQNAVKKPVLSIVASEFDRQTVLLGEKDLLIAVTQSGETADTLEAIQTAKAHHIKIVSFVNVEGSTVDRQSDFTLYHKVGVEKAVASTKATTAPMVLYRLLSELYLNQNISEVKQNVRNELTSISLWMTLKLEKQTKALAMKIQRYQDIYLIGRGLGVSLAQEGAIKIQELSNVHAEGLPAGELKHFAISLIHKGTPCFVLVTAEKERKRMLSNAMEVKARGGFIIGIDDEPSPVFDEYIKIPNCGILKSIAILIPLQFFAYHLALLHGCDPDYCRNLAKSVTVI